MTQPGHAETPAPGRMHCVYNRGPVQEARSGGCGSAGGAQVDGTAPNGRQRIQPLPRPVRLAAAKQVCDSLFSAGLTAFQLVTNVTPEHPCFRTGEEKTTKVRKSRENAEQPLDLRKHVASHPFVWAAKEESESKRRQKHSPALPYSQHATTPPIALPR